MVLSKSVANPRFLSASTEQSGDGGQRKWYRSKLARINLAIGLLIATSLASFVLARDTVFNQRHQRMRVRKDVEKTVLQEIVTPDTKD